MKVSPAKQAPQGYLVVQISTGVQEFYSEYAWKVFTAKVLPSKTYPLYGIKFISDKSACTEGLAIFRIIQKIF